MRRTLALLVSAVAGATLVSCSSTSSHANGQSGPPTTPPTAQPTLLYATGLPGDRDGNLLLTPAEYRDLAFAGFHRGDANGDRLLAETEVPSHELVLHDAADASNDGVLTISELLDHKAREFVAADLNMDGVLDLDEWSAAAHAEILLVTDTNANGVVDREELIVAMRVTFTRLDGNGSGTLTGSERCRDHFVVFDLDRDGTITRTEWDTAVQAAFDEAPQPLRLPTATSGS